VLNTSDEIANLMSTLAGSFDGVVQYNLGADRLILPIHSPCSPHSWYLARPKFDLTRI
jgi:hypothetical protein